MNKSEWYKFLFGRVDDATSKKYFFEAAFICYGIIEDRLTSLLEINAIAVPRGVAAKVKALARRRSASSEAIFGFDKWDGGKYKSYGELDELLAWGLLYRNPMQHHLGDPQKYLASVGDFHNQHSKDLAIEGARIARQLSSAVMRYKKYRNRRP